MRSDALPPALAADEVVHLLPLAGSVLCYQRPGVGRPLLLLHSINAAASAFEVKPFFESMGLQMPLYAPDLPGFGRSDRADIAYSPEFYARVIIDLVVALDVGPVDVVALSTTAEFAARAVRESPALFNSLTLVSPTGFSRRKAGPSSVGPRVHRFLRLPILGAGLFRTLRTRPSIRFFLDKAFKDGAPNDMVDYAYACAAQPGASHAPFYFVSGQLFAPDAVGDLYEPLQLPVLVLYDKDPNISFTHLDELARGHSNWQLARIPETLGLPQFEEPQLTEEALQGFLQNLA